MGSHQSTTDSFIQCLTMGHRTVTSASLLVCLYGVIGLANAGAMLQCNQPASESKTIYDFGLQDINKQKNISLSDYKGKVVLIVNVATYWGFVTHYLGMNALNTKYGAQGFTVLGFPSNIFLHQEPGWDGAEILRGVKYVRPGNDFVPNFQLFEKIDVNGDKEHPLYTYLKAQCPPTVKSFDPSIRFYTPIQQGDISWNWETFLVGADGKVIKRAPPNVEPKDLEADIEDALAAAAKNSVNSLVG